MIFRKLGQLATRAALAGGAVAFRRFQQPRARPPYPDWTGSRALEAVSRDGTAIRGWWQPEAQRAGTIIFIHGITIHSFHYVEQAKELSRQTGLAVAALDLRFHGLSGDGPLTFGAAEAWDVRAFLDSLEAVAASRPFILIGDSLGGLATQRAAIEDPRIDGAILMQVPGWPWNAITKAGRMFAPLAGFLNAHFGHDILSDGDVRNFPSTEICRPPMLYVVGDRDFYRWQATKLIYDWWGTANSGAVNETPLTSPNRTRWFILVEGAEHDTGLPDSYNVWRWPLIWPNMVRFIEIVSARFAQAN